MTGTQLPSNWVTVSLGDIRIDRGSRVVPAEAPDEMFELFSIPSFPTGQAEVVSGSAIGSDKQSAEMGTVLVSKINPRINRVWVVRPRTRHRVIVSTEWVPFSPIEGIIPEYLAFYLQRDEFREYLAINVSGVGGSLMRVRPAVIDKYPLALAPTAEQRRIVAALEEHLSDLDAAVEGLERAHANANRYRTAVISAAVIGALDSSAVASQHSGNVQLPHDWEWVELRAVADIKGGITKGQRRRSDEVVRTVPYLRVANVQRGYLDLTEVKQIDATASEIQQLRLQPGDVLFNEGGDRDKLGRGWVWAGEIAECIHQNHVFRARLEQGRMNPKFVSFYGNTWGQRYFLEQGRQTTNLASINLTKLGSLPIPAPAKSTQDDMVEEIECRLAGIDRIAAEVEVQLARATRLRQSILKRAFEGKLVPQDPNDEPASVLLSRIRTERRVSPTRTARSRRSSVTPVSMPNITIVRTGELVTTKHTP